MGYPPFVVLSAILVPASQDHENLFCFGVYLL